MLVKAEIKVCVIIPFEFLLQLCSFLRLSVFPLKHAKNENFFLQLQINICSSFLRFYFRLEEESKNRYLNLNNDPDYFSFEDLHFPKKKTWVFFCESIFHISENWVSIIFMVRFESIFSFRIFSNSKCYS